MYITLRCKCILLEVYQYMDSLLYIYSIWTVSPFPHNFKIVFALPMTYKAIPCRRAMHARNIQNLPLTAAPEVFGLHENASITRAQSDTAQLLKSVLLTESTGGGSGGADKETTISAAAADILSKVFHTHNLGVPCWSPTKRPKHDSRHDKGNSHKKLKNVVSKLRVLQTVIYILLYESVGQRAAESPAKLLRTEINN